MISLKTELTRLIELPNKKEVRENYQMKVFHEWIVFSKKNGSDNGKNDD
jgi:hypothetical protein